MTCSMQPALDSASSSLLGSAGFERIEAAPELHVLVWQDVRAAKLKRFRYVVHCIVRQHPT
jgi:hypothetical protein